MGSESPLLIRVFSSKRAFSSNPALKYASARKYLARRSSGVFPSAPLNSSIDASYSFLLK
jgi:hypothetical protein